MLHLLTLLLVVLVIGLASFACGLVLLVVLSLLHALLGRMIQEERWSLAKLFPQYFTSGRITVAGIAVFLVFLWVIWGPMMERIRTSTAS